MSGHRKALVYVALAVGLVTAGCATSRSGEASRQEVLTREEIMGVQGAQNLYDVVQRLRPRWLTVRAAQRSMYTQTGIVVYQNQSYQGDLETLRQFHPEAAYELRFLDGPTASASLPGLPGSHVAGAIIISTTPPGS
jgi:hypothetical protein